jgi:hypothetical protein
MLKSNPFTNYRQALIYLRIYRSKLYTLSDYEPSNLDWAIITLLKSKILHKKLR